MQSQFLEGSIQEQEKLGVGAFNHGYMKPWNRWQLTPPDTTGGVRFGFNAEVDVTGASKDDLIALEQRLSCLMYVAFMPMPGLEDSFRHLRDTFDWFTKGREEPKAQIAHTYSATELAIQSAPAFSKEEE